MITIILVLGGYGLMAVKSFKMGFNRALTYHKEQFSMLKPESHVGEFVIAGIFAGLFWPVFFPAMVVWQRILKPYAEAKVSPEKAAEQKLWKS